MDIYKAPSPLNLFDSNLFEKRIAKYAFKLNFISNCTISFLTKFYFFVTCLSAYSIYTHLKQQRPKDYNFHDESVKRH